MTKNLHTLFLTSFFVLSVILGALLDQIHADISELNESKPQTHSMRLEMLNNGKIHSYELDGVNYKLVRSDEK
jgi:hypothetical protein